MQYYDPQYTNKKLMMNFIENTKAKDLAKDVK
jgi:hypothetical protein